MPIFGSIEFGQPLETSRTLLMSCCDGTAQRHDGAVGSAANLVKKEEKEEKERKKRYSLVLSCCKEAVLSCTIWDPFGRPRLIGEQKERTEEATQIPWHNKR